MAKIFSQQLAEQRARQQLPIRLTRTQRKIASIEQKRKEQQAQQQELARNREVILTQFADELNVEGYTKTYYTLPPEIRSQYPAPEEIQKAYEEKLNQDAYNLAVDWVNRRLEGKRVVMTSQYAEGEEKARIEKAQEYYSQIIRENPEYKEQMYQAGIKRISTETGYKTSQFKSLNEYQAVTGFLNEQREMDSIQKQALAVETFQEKYPTEKLVYGLVPSGTGKQRTITGVESQLFGYDWKTGKGTFIPLEEYNKKVEQYNLEHSADYLYNKWLEEQKTKPIYLDIEIRNGIIYPLTVKETETKKENKYLNWIKKNVTGKWHDIKIPIWSDPYGRTGFVSYKEIAKGYTSSTPEIKEKLIQEKLERTGIKEKAETLFQEEYQTRFEQTYMKDLIYENIDFETAEKEFSESQVAKNITQKYQNYIDKELINTGITHEDYQLVGVGLGETFFKYTPKTWEGIGATAVVGTGAYATITTIPPSVLNVASIGITGYELATGFDKTINPTKRAGAFVGAGIGTTLLTYQGIKYLRTPTTKVKYDRLLSNVSNKAQKSFVLKSKPSVTIKDIYGKTTQIDYFKASKLTEQIAFGRRTIVSTKWRDLLGIKPIYEGIPYKQLGETYRIAVSSESLRTSATYNLIYKTPSAYQKAYKLLITRGGLTPYQARQTLQFHHAQRSLSQFDADIIFKSGDYFKTPEYTIKGTRDIFQQPEIVNQQLGIKSAGKVPVKEYISGKGFQVGSIKGKPLYRTTYNIEKSFLTKEDFPYQKLTQAGKTTTKSVQYTLVNEAGKGVLKVEALDRGILASKDYPYSIYNEQSIIKQVLPKGKISFGESRSAFFDKEKLPIEIDIRQILREEKGIIISDDISRTKEISNAKRLEDAKYLKEVLKTLKNIYGTGTIGKIKVPITPKTKSLGFAPTETIKASQELKSSLAPLKNLKTQIKNLFGVETSGKFSQVAFAGTSTTTTLDVGLAEESRTRGRFNLSDRNLLRDAINTLSLERTGTRGKQIQIQNQIYRQDFFVTPPVINIDTKTPKIPTIKTPSIIVPPFWLNPEKQKKLKEKLKKRKDFELGLLPDFSARIVGLEAEEIAIKNVNKAVRRLQTGLEIRRGGRIKWQ